MGNIASQAGAFRNPEITVQKVEVCSISLSGVPIEATLQIFNPNVTATLEGQRIVYQVKKASDETVIAEGVFNKEFTVSPRKSIVITVPMTLKYGGMGAAGKSLVQRGKTEILVSGDVTFHAALAPGGTVTVPYKGELDIILSEE